MQAHGEHRHQDGKSLVQRLAAELLMACGAALVGLGLYFILLRPPLLPEDARYVGAALPDIERAVPGLGAWLQKVFWVLGGYMASTGLLTVYIAARSSRARRVEVTILAVAGLTSIGWMALVNFVLDSDFKFPLLGLASSGAAPWRSEPADLGGRGSSIAVGAFRRMRAVVVRSCMFFGTSAP